MTKQEIITLLIKDYEEAIEKCKGMRYEDIHDYLDQINLDRGICLYAVVKYYISLSDKLWVLRNVDKNTIWGAYWAEPAWRYFNKKSIIQSLQTRLSILKTELEIPE